MFPTIKNLNYSPELKEKAEAAKETLIRIEINGHFADAGCMQMTGRINMKTTDELHKFIRDKIFGSKEMVK